MGKDLQGFTFYRSFYRQGKRLKKNERHQFYDNVMDYMFEGVEPQGNNYVLGAFEAIEPILNKSLKNSANGASKDKSETESNTKRNKNETKAKSETKEIETATNTPQVTDTYKDTLTDTLLHSSSTKSGKTVLDIMTEDDYKKIEKHCTNVIAVTDRISDRKSIEEIEHPYNYFMSVAMEMGEWV